MTYEELLTPQELKRVEEMLADGWELATIPIDGSRVDDDDIWFDVRKFPLFTVKDDN